MGVSSFVLKIANLLFSMADTSGSSDDIYVSRLGGGDSELELIEKISMTVLNKNPGTSLAFIKLITKEVVGEYKKTHHPHHQGTQ